ncbi:MAG: class I SAM-dependent methyltransferase [Deltaproteobacteria bacterium]|nr:class I SAM-dependent methyltransferase [Candidatus Anaeroferrophillus wilburensis]MBN2888317.1 class I SAM-dependent methyltransferase [Deltaproteobacteria bacterium]
MLSVEHDPFTPEFWRIYAEKRRKSFENRKITTAKKWDDLADHYHKFENADDFVADQQWITNQLHDQQILQPGYSVVDIACGPGTHCFDFAKSCKRVVAVDVSPKMIEQLLAKKKERQTANLEVICADFYQYDPPETFDLVFVSMSPILNDLASVDRLLSMSSRYLALAYWAGIRENPMYNHCHQLVYDEPYVWDPLDIVAIFNYLYALGYSPQISFQHATWKRQDTVAHVIDHTIWHLEFQRSLTGAEKDAVSAYISSFGDSQGMVSYDTRVRKGCLILDKQVGRPDDDQATAAV